MGLPCLAANHPNTRGEFTYTNVEGEGVLSVIPRSAFAFKTALSAGNVVLRFCYACFLW